MQLKYYLQNMVIIIQNSIIITRLAKPLIQEHKHNISHTKSTRKKPYNLHHYPRRSVTLQIYV